MSPYEPEFLYNSTEVYFGYAIYQQIVCQASRLIILCPLDLVIHVFSAYYGIQSTTMSSTCAATTSSGEQPAKCYIPKALDSMRETCESKSSCQLRASANSLGGGDYCPSYSKQLFVQYQCIHPTVLNTTLSKCPSLDSTIPPICSASSTLSNTSIGVGQVQSNTWCDGSSMSIKCATGKSISILCAFYGIHPSIDACNIQSLVNIPVCYFASSQTLVSNLCNGQSSCSIDTLSSFFALDPCVGLDKALFVQWMCV
jgi:hypothetical protein